MTDNGDTPLASNDSDEFNSDDDGLGLYNAFDDDILEPESTGGRKSEKGGHKFMIFVGILGAIIIIVLIGLVLYSGMIQPQRTISHTQIAAEVHAQNTVTSILATSISMTKTAIADKVLIKESETSPSRTITVERVEVEPKEMASSIATMAPTKTPFPIVAESNSSAKSIADEQLADHTATVAALLTLSAGDGKTQSVMTSSGPVVRSEAMTSTAEVEGSGESTETSLPATGVIDEIGLVSLLGGTVVLLGVIIIARRLRKR